MWWRRKQHVTVPTDVEEARKLRDEQQHQLDLVRRRQPYVQRLTSRLIARRDQNHFGEDIQITFTPRGHHG